MAKDTATKSKKTAESKKAESETKENQELVPVVVETKTVAPKQPKENQKRKREETAASSAQEGEKKVKENEENETSAEVSTDYKRIVFTSVPEEATVADITALFTDATEPPHIKILVTDSKEKVGIAIATFKTDAGFQEASQIPSFIVKGVNLEVKLNPKADPNTSVVVNAYPGFINEETIKSFFSDCGEVADIHYTSDMKGRIKKIALVEFSDSESKDKALAKAKIEHEGHKISIFPVKAPSGTTRTRSQTFKRGRARGRGRGREDKKVSQGTKNIAKKTETKAVSKPVTKPESKPQTKPQTVPKKESAKINPAKQQASPKPTKVENKPKNEVKQAKVSNPQKGKGKK
jgi:hypothetical protein